SSVTSSVKRYTLSLHDALPISAGVLGRPGVDHERGRAVADSLLRRTEQPLVGEGHMGTDLHAHAPHGLCSPRHRDGLLRQRTETDRKSTRLNSSHVKISYAVFC